MRDGSAIAWASGPTVAIGYLIGAVVAWRNRRPRPRMDPWWASLFEAITMVITVVFVVAAMSLLEPDFDYSRIAYLSDQVLPAVVSISLWVSAATLLGMVSPVFLGFRGSNGIAAATILLMMLSPMILLGASAAGLAAYAVFRNRHEAYAVSFIAIPTLNYLAWVTNRHDSFGISYGPELTLWSAVITTLLLTAWWRVPLRRQDQPPTQIDFDDDRF